MRQQFTGVPRATNFIPAEGGDDTIGAIGDPLVPRSTNFILTKGGDAPIWYYSWRVHKCTRSTGKKCHASRYKRICI